MAGTTHTFSLHERLAADTFVLGELPVSRLLLMNDARFTWCILVPRFPGLRELHDLPAAARSTLLEEIERVSRAFLEHFGAEKINVGALGNLVPQLHVHVVGRSARDEAWPGPVWGAGTPRPYDAGAGVQQVRRLREALNLVDPSLNP